jgi:lipopolysaccharide transport system permease protein
MATLLSAISEMDTTYHLRIQPSKNSFGLGLWELWKFRELLMALVMRDIKLRYRQTALGVAWVILQPLLASGILAFVFGTVAGVTKPGRSSIFIFVLGGFIGWSLFSATLSRASQSLVQHSALIAKVFFPRIILPASAAFSALLDVVVALALFSLLAILSRTPFGWEIVMVPVWLGFLLMLSFGLGLFSAALSVRFLLNPLAPLFEGLRWSLLTEGQFHLWQTLYALLFSLVVLALGLVFFRNAEREFSDVI